MSVRFFSLGFFLKCLPSRGLVGWLLYPWNFKPSLAVTIGWFLFLIYYMGRLSICRFKFCFSSVKFSTSTPSGAAASTTGSAARVFSCWEQCFLSQTSPLGTLYSSSSLWSLSAPCVLRELPSPQVSLISSPEYFLSLTTSLHPNHSHSNRSSCLVLHFYNSFPTKQERKRASLLKCKPSHSYTLLTSFIGFQLHSEENPVNSRPPTNCLVWPCGS